MSEDSENETELPQLEVVLTAGGVEVARSKNRQIWLSTMAAITGAQSAKLQTGHSNVVDAGGGAEREGVGHEDGVTPRQRFASELGISEEALEAAAYPTESEPYIELDPKYWEAFRRTNGYGRTAPSVLVATLILLWDLQIKSVGDLGTRECAKVFTAIGLNDKNPTRSIRNCDWLQLRGSVIKLNPQMISRAEEVASTYCTAKS